MRAAVTIPDLEYAYQQTQRLDGMILVPDGWGIDEFMDLVADYSVFRGMDWAPGLMFDGRPN